MTDKTAEFLARADAVLPPETDAEREARHTARAKKSERLLHQNQGLDACDPYREAIVQVSHIARSGLERANNGYMGAAFKALEEIVRRLPSEVVVAADTIPATSGPDLVSRLRAEGAAVERENLEPLIDELILHANRGYGPLTHGHQRRIDGALERGPVQT